MRDSLREQRDVMVGSTLYWLLSQYCHSSPL